MYIHPFALVNVILAPTPGPVDLAIAAPMHLEVVASVFTANLTAKFIPGVAATTRTIDNVYAVTRRDARIGIADVMRFRYSKPSRGDIMREAHRMARRVKARNPGDDYRVTLGMALRYLHAFYNDLQTTAHAA